MFYAAGNIAGANILFAREAPRYYSGLTGLISCYCGMVVVAGFLAGWMAWENKSRDRKYGQGEDQKAIVEGFEDRTDGEAKHFRYAL